MGFRSGVPTISFPVDDQPGNDFTTFRQAKLDTRTIHIVETDTALCEALSTLFRLEGYRVAYSTKFDLFVTNAASHSPDVVVTSMSLGDETGLSVLKWLRRERPGSYPVLLMDQPDMEVGVLAARLGAIDVPSRSTLNVFCAQ
jgi:two-component system response regulator FixJ